MHDVAQRARLDEQDARGVQSVEGGPGHSVASQESGADQGSQELDGPPVVAPTRQGFGRILLEKVAAQDFDALPKISFAPEGLTYEIDAPLSVIAAGSGEV